MAIDRSGKWWMGSQPEDLKAYLEALSANSYPVHEFHLSKCTCGCVVFRLHADDASGVARRTCVYCKREWYIGDSEEFWGEAEPELWECTECGSKSANIGVGYSLYANGEIHWMYVGERCDGCGVLGCFVSWKVGYSPSRHLLKKA
jgi:hypothetical protein